MKISEEHWEFLLKYERAGGERYVLNHGFTIEDYNRFRQAYLNNKLEEYKREEIVMAKSTVNPQDVIKLYKEGATLYAISKKLKVGPPMIKKILRENGLLEKKAEEPKKEEKTEKKVEKIEEPKINNPRTELDHIAVSLTEEELRGYIKGNVIILLSSDMKKAEEYLSWYNRR